VSATTPIVLITTEVSPIIIAHLPHTISGTEIRKPQKVGVAKKYYASRKGKLSHVLIVSAIGVCDLDKILLLDVTPAPKGQDNFISARLGST
jgi:hypothetical protein